MSTDISDTLSILEKLVEFDTTSHKSNIPLIRWVSSYLEGYGVSHQLIPDESGKKENLIAQIGQSQGRGIVFSGHTDVVPAIKDKWAYDPFKLQRRGDRLYGRGTTDMKSFLANVLAAVPSMVQAPLNRPITLAFSYDEEVGCLGAPALVELLPENQHVIVGEPTRLLAGVCHKGARLYSAKITGVAAHSGTPELGVNSIVHMQLFAAKLQTLAEKLASVDAEYISNLVITNINGGHAPNIVPDHCEMTWLFRPANQHDADEVGREIQDMVCAARLALKAENERAEIELSSLCDVPSYVSGYQSDIVNLSQQCSGRQGQIELSFATEAGIFAAAGHDVVVCGPGDMAQGHIDDEYIDIAALVAGQQFIGNVVDAASA